MKRPTIGELNKFVIIRKRQDISTYDNQTEPIYLIQKKRWANINPVSGSTYLLSQQANNTITHRIKLRYDATITADHEVVHGAIIYRVHRCSDIRGEGRFTLLEVEELNHE